MRRTSFEDMNCSVAQCLEVVGEWWSLLIVRDAILGVRRFDDFQARLGISRNVLNQRLQHLVERGVLERVQYQTNPVRHEYRLTDKGRALWPVLAAMRQWGDTWEPRPDGPSTILVHTGCGEHVHVVPTCSACAEELVYEDMRMLPGPSSDGSVLPVRRPRVEAGTAGTA
jgi:DNA-binding HxlR family transcriptional regulator